MTEILDGTASAMTVEPVAGDGAELWVDHAGQRSFDQVKFRSSRSWTIGRLTSDGVLPKVLPHLRAGAAITLVITSASDELDRLIAYAKASESSAVFESVASENRILVDRLSSSWHAEIEETWQYLRSITVRHENLERLEELVRLKLGTLIRGDGREVADLLASWIPKILHREITARDILDMLEKRGFPAKPAADHGSAMLKLRETVQRQVARVHDSLPPLGAIERHEKSIIIDHLTRENGPRIVIVHGKAGSGKSALTAAVASDIFDRGHPVAAARMDRVPEHVSTARQLGGIIDLDDSPVILIYEARRDSRPGLLLVDQLDAVSTYSGRMPDTFDAVSDLIHQSRALRHVKLLLAVRTIDLEQDPRMRRLAQDSDVETVEVGDLDPEDVATYLRDLGYDPTTLSPQTLDLLRVPIHLYVFCQLEREDRTQAFQALPDLYSSYTTTFRNRLHHRGLDDHWAATSKILVERMSQDETLSAPKAILNALPPLYIDALISENVLIDDNGRVAFFHETFFDFLFARSFSHRGEDLVQSFVASGQGLFRRSQLRQVLAYIASREPLILTSQVLAIARSEMRPHLVATALTVLPQSTPQDGDWDLLEPTLMNPGLLGEAVQGLLRVPAWFDEADRLGRIEALLDQEDSAHSTLAAVITHVSRVSGRVRALIAPLLAEATSYTSALRQVFDHAESSASVDYALELLSNGALDGDDGDFFDPLGARLFYRLNESSPLGVIELLRVVLERAIRIADQRGEFDPFAAGIVSGKVRIRGLKEIAAAHPMEFVGAVGPLVLRLGDERQDSIERASGTRWRWVIRSNHHEFVDELFFAYREALRELARRKPDALWPILDDFDQRRSRAFDFLTAFALRSAPADKAVDWLLADESHLQVGWSDSSHWESRRLIERASRRCSEVSFRALEIALMNYVTPNERRAHNLRWRGMTELEFLTALSAERIQDSTSSRIAELRRKFPNWTPRAPRGVISGTVASPIPPGAPEKMTDTQWVSALQRYPDQHDSSRWLAGGSWELSQDLARVAGADPPRFTALALTFPPSMVPEYGASILRSVADHIDERSLTQLCWKLVADHPAHASRPILDVIDTLSEPLSDDMLDLLRLAAADSDPDAPESGEAASDASESDLTTIGLNCVRGRAAWTIARLLFRDPSQASRLEPLVSELVGDIVPAVRVMAAEAILALSNADRVRALELARRILNGDDELFAARPVLQLLRYCVLWEPDEFASALDRALVGPDQEAAGAVWVNSHVNGAIRSTRFGAFADLSESARAGAAAALCRNPALDPDLVVDIFSDESSVVRGKATAAIQELDSIDEKLASELLTRYIESEALPSAIEFALAALESATFLLPSVSLNLCSRALSILEDAPKEQRHWIDWSHLVTVLVRLYRQSPSLREDCLDLIDRLVLLRAWGIERELDSQSDS
ncbi:hypothetical protein ITJ64_01880 [Herbiconiux sp. VKM Ac-1786]|uniref:NACHT domain-containing protein n=1 Tax=Herbiconiux sp. VKM Ac-1786 TaxID=2783824 RepID=UPI00188D4EF8|nr:NACHT domain-containing protein [Herbiconiux sp. VKM Ac-1786]MBF4571259.1 hypothetical protein [Herbiconiux sp. VKM Ac-1786]